MAIFGQKFHAENVSQNNRQTWDKTNMSVSPCFFCLFYPIFGCFSAMGFQKHYPKRFTKKVVSKKSKTDCSTVFVLPRFWAFLGEGLDGTKSGLRQRGLPVSKCLQLGACVLWPCQGYFQVPPHRGRAAGRLCDAARGGGWQCVECLATAFKRSPPGAACAAARARTSTRSLRSNKKVAVQLRNRG
jgi:hypothetical protein